MSLWNKYSNCIDEEIKETKQPRIVLKERRSRYELVNESACEVTKFIVEGCITNETGEKGCEAILFAKQLKVRSKAFYIELKGISVGDALKQIQSSLNKTKRDLKDVQLYGRIIPSAYKRTKFLESLEKSLSNQFRLLGGDLIIRENYSDTI